jgi:hypothetical protein
VGDVADQIRPGDGVGGAHKVRVCDWAEGFAYVGCVGDIAMGGEEDGAESNGVSGVSVWSVGGIYGAVRVVLISISLCKRICGVHCFVLRCTPSIPGHVFFFFLCGEMRA